MPIFRHDELAFHYRDEGQGVPFVFQHGLGGDTNQTFDLFTPPAGIRLITLDCRAHGATQPVGEESKLGFEDFAADVVALLDHLGIERAIVGGISMGAGVALTLALRHTIRVRALILSRPAWLDRPLPAHLLVYPTIAYLLRTFGPVEGRRQFALTGAYAHVLAESSDAAASLLGQFDADRAVERAARLVRIPLDCPCARLDACRGLDRPVLVLVNRQDPIHPYELALQLAAYFPSPQFAEVTAKSVSRQRHREDVQRTLEVFLADVARHSPQV